MCIDVLFHSGEYFMNCHKSRPATGNGRVWRVAMSGCGEWQWAGVASGNGQLWRVAVGGCGEWQWTVVASGSGWLWRVAMSGCDEWQWVGVSSGNGRLWRLWYLWRVSRYEWMTGSYGRNANVCANMQEPPHQCSENLRETQILELVVHKCACTAMKQKGEV